MTKGYVSPEFAAAIYLTLEHVNKLMADHWADRKYTHARPPTVEVESIGDSYIKLNRMNNLLDGTKRSHGVYCFIAHKAANTKAIGPVKEGDILKAATYKAPAKHARGNIYTDLSHLTDVGVAYLR